MKTESARSHRLNFLVNIKLVSIITNSLEKENVDELLQFGSFNLVFLAGAILPSALFVS